MFNSNLIILMVFSYLLGNISPAIIISRMYSNQDIRESGSGNAGTTNVLRTMGKKFGAIVFVLDVLKGAFPAYLGMMYGGLELGFLCGLLVVLGHVFPVIHHFRGGKGVATSFGAVLVLHPLFALISITVFAILVATTRYVSVGSILGTCTFPLLMIWRTQNRVIWFYSLIFALIIIFSHRNNIKKLLNGTENRFGKR